MNATLIKVEAVNFEPPVGWRLEVDTRLGVERRQVLDVDLLARLLRVMDLMTPVGKGQRGPIVAPPRTGKTMPLTRLSTLFSAIALFPAATGLFGVTSYGVARRRSELAVRIALGANGADVIRDVLLSVVAPVALGLAGVPCFRRGSRGLCRRCSSALRRDPTTLLIGTLALMSTALVAGCLPGAFRIDPVEVLRASWAWREAVPGSREHTQRLVSCECP